MNISILCIYVKGNKSFAWLFVCLCYTYEKKNRYMALIYIHLKYCKSMCFLTTNLNVSHVIQSCIASCLIVLISDF